MFDRARILGFLIVAAWPAAAWPTAAQSQTLVPPVAVDLVEASWPEAEPIAGRGMVEVLTRLAIDATGVVTDVEILGSAGALFDEAARAALLASRFEPALRDGAPIAARIELRFVFRAPAPPPEPEPEPEAAAPSPVVVPPAVDDGP
ncbi:MAG: TonB family protein, partial [Sandaracinaceae bacterium]|nr:TonB family protein [Sandaracinaceae bacterium]